MNFLIRHPQGTPQVIFLYACIKCLCHMMLLRAFVSASHLVMEFTFHTTFLMPKAPPSRADVNNDWIKICISNGLLTSF